VDFTKLKLKRHKLIHSEKFLFQKVSPKECSSLYVSNSPPTCTFDCTEHNSLNQ
jgi:hypothetical protein